MYGQHAVPYTLCIESVHVNMSNDSHPALAPAAVAVSGCGCLSHTTCITASGAGDWCTRHTATASAHTLSVTLELIGEFTSGVAGIQKGR